jgi:hypothetical protein
MGLRTEGATMLESLTTLKIARDGEHIYLSLPGAASGFEMRLTVEQAYQLSQLLFDHADSIKYGPTHKTDLPKS